MRKQKGFSLIELLIVVAIILIIAAIAIPNLMRSKMAANEAAAAANLRTINTAEVTYYSAYGDVGYTKDLASLAGTCTTATPPSATAACLIDDTLAAATDSAHAKSGYIISFKPGDAASGATVQTSYTINSDPQSASTGTRHFFTDQTAVIRYNKSAVAAATDGAI
jgi:type IV pilus assembly protein PilA